MGRICAPTAFYHSACHRILVVGNSGFTLLFAPRRASCPTPLRWGCFTFCLRQQGHTHLPMRDGIKPFLPPPHSQCHRVCFFSAFRRIGCSEFDALLHFSFLRCKYWFLFYPSFEVSVYHFPIDVVIISHIVIFVKGFLKLFSKSFSLPCVQNRECRLGLLSLSP